MKSISANGAQPGVLRLAGGRLSFTPGADGRPTGPPAFDVALSEVEGVKWPRYNAGTVVRFVAGGTKHRLTFMPPTKKQEWAGLGIIDIPQARRFGASWKEALGG